MQVFPDNSEELKVNTLNKIKEACRYLQFIHVPFTI